MPVTTHPRRVILVPAILALILAGAMPALSEEPKAPVGGTICQGNDIYVVCVDDIGARGRYTARTGPGHPVPGRNLLYGGEGGSPGTSFNSYRSFTSGATYVQGGSLNGYVTSVEPIGTTGVRTTYQITGTDDLEIVEVVNVNGTTLANSNVEIATTIRNTGEGAVAVGARYLWDYQIGADDGPTFQAKSPDGPVLVNETDFIAPGFTYQAVQDNDFDDPTSPLYTVLGSVNGPASVTPAPTAPSRLAFACWSPAFGSTFDYTVVPTRDCASGGGDSAILYWWGHDAGSALQLGAGDEVTERALLFASEPDGPPPFEEEGTDLAIDKTDTPDPVTTGGVVRYTITVDNQGESASSVHVLDTPDSGEVVGAEGSGWTCEIVSSGDDVGPGTSASCTLDEPLEDGATAPPLHVYVQAPETAGTITNTATVSGDDADPDPEDNTATEETTVQQAGGEGEQQVITFCPPSGCTFSTGDEPTEDDPTTNLVEVPPGGDGSVTTLHEGATTYPCGGGGFGSSSLGQETNFAPPTGIVDPADPIKVTTTWDVSVWPIHKGISDPGVSNGDRGRGQVRICMRKIVEGPDGPEEVVFRLPRCKVVGLADPAPCWDQVSRDADGDISVRILMLSEDPQWRR